MLLGAAGEHYVMCQFLRRGLIAALAPVGVPNADLIVTDDIGEKLCAIQVKTRVDKGSDGGWHMSKKHEDIVSENLLYAFIDFGGSLVDPPECFIVPSAEVAAAVKESHALWLATPGKRGQQRNDSNMRRFLPDYSKVGLDIGRTQGWLDPYREAWHLAEAHS
ncbi:hypothetical protein [Rhodobacter sp. JA431]|uniref:hypothetical protein n=1 Tax=Rhodobacter sp. JA431 TaxID=570013 RepID=UPI001BAF6D01|nr:hypothetical protein [Rhodobacter sp. JA431]